MPAHTHRGQFVTPNNTLQLMQALGATRAADVLGVSTTLLYTARQNGEVSKVVEKAAEGALRAPLRRLPANDPRPEPTPPAAAKAPEKPEAEPIRLVLIEVAKSKVPVVEKMAQALRAPMLVS